MKIVTKNKTKKEQKTFFFSPSLLLYAAQPIFRFEKCPVIHWLEN